MKKRKEKRDGDVTGLLRACCLLEGVDVLSKQNSPGRRDELKEVEEFCVALCLAQAVDLELQEAHAHRMAHVEQLLLELLHPVGTCVAVLHYL